MKVLQINCVYPNGSTGKITEDISFALKKMNHKTKVLYSRGPKTQKDAVRVCSAFASKINHAIANITGLVYGGCFWQTLKIIRFISKEKPDIVHLQCINGYFVNIYRLITFLKKNKIPTVITLHAEFMYTANCDLTLGCECWKNGCVNCPNYHKATGSYFFNRTKTSFLLMKKAFEKFDKNVTIVGVSDWITNRASSSPILNKSNFSRIYNGIDVKTFSSRDSRNISENLQIGNRKLILWVTSGFTLEKGKDYFYKLVEVMNAEKYIFAVVGVDGTESEKLKNVIFLGKIYNKDKLASLYSAADVVISCSRQESYPTVFLEAQCCSTPVVGFDVGGVAEAVFEGMGATVALGDINAMASALEFWSNQKPKIKDEIKKACINTFSLERMGEEYIKLYNSMIGNNLS